MGDSKKPSKAITFIFEKGNFSIFGDTLTFYWKKNGVPYSMHDSASDYADSRLSMNQVINKYLVRYLKGNVFRKNPKHQELHFDLFNKDHDHTHLQFNNPIDADMLNIVLKGCVKKGLLTKKEQKDAARIFALANTMNETEVVQKQAEIHLQTLKDTIEENYKTNNDVYSSCQTLLTILNQFIKQEQDIQKIQYTILMINIVLNKPTKENVTHLQQIGLSFMDSDTSNNTQTVINKIMKPELNHTTEIHLDNSHEKPPTNHIKQDPQKAPLLTLGKALLILGATLFATGVILIPFASVGIVATAVASGSLLFLGGTLSVGTSVEKEVLPQQPAFP